MINQTLDSALSSKIDVGNRPNAMAIPEIMGTIYVVNGGFSNEHGTVSVISIINNTKIGEDIPVGDNPSAIAIDEATSTAYVVNSGFFSSHGMNLLFLQLIIQR